MIPAKYTAQLSRKDTKKQRNMLLRSRRMYTKGKYYTRKPLASYKHKTSNHIENARRMYGVDKVLPNKELAIKTGCPVSALKAIVRKGEGAYYSSGSRPNQTAQSWGIARLASAITGGKAAKVDFHILKGCANKRAYKLAKKLDIMPTKFIKRKHKKNKMTNKRNNISIRKTIKFSGGASQIEQLQATRGIANRFMSVWGIYRQNRILFYQQGYTLKDLEQFRDLATQTKIALAEREKGDPLATYFIYQYYAILETAQEVATQEEQAKEAVAQEEAAQEEAVAQEEAAQGAAEKAGVVRLATLWQHYTAQKDTFYQQGYTLKDLEQFRDLATQTKFALELIAGAEESENRTRAFEFLKQHYAKQQDAQQVAAQEEQAKEAVAQEEAAQEEAAQGAAEKAGVVRLATLWQHYTAQKDTFYQQGYTLKDLEQFRDLATQTKFALDLIAGAEESVNRTRALKFLKQHYAIQQDAQQVAAQEEQAKEAVAAEQSVAGQAQLAKQAVAAEQGAVELYNGGDIIAQYNHLYGPGDYKQIYIWVYNTHSNLSNPEWITKYFKDKELAEYVASFFTVYTCYEVYDMPHSSEWMHPFINNLEEIAVQIYQIEQETPYPDEFIFKEFGVKTRTFGDRKRIFRLVLELGRKLINDRNWKMRTIGTFPRYQDKALPRGTYKTIISIPGNHVFVNSQLYQKPNVSNQKAEFLFTERLGILYPGICVESKHLFDEGDEGTPLLTYPYLSSRANKVEFTEISTEKEYNQYVDGAFEIFNRLNIPLANKRFIVCWFDAKSENIGINGKGQYMVIDVDPRAIIFIDQSQKSRYIVYQYFIFLCYFLLFGTKTSKDLRAKICKERIATLSKGAFQDIGRSDVDDYLVDIGDTPNIKANHSQGLQEIGFKKQEADRIAEGLTSPLRFFQAYLGVHIQKFKACFTRS